METSISDLMKKFSDMIDNSKKNESNNIFDFSKFSPNDFKNIVQEFNNNTDTNTNTNTNINIDINTILKIKSIMDKMNTTNDPRKNLLISLKPYVRESRRKKIDQYINLFSMSKIMDTLKESLGDNK